MKTTLTRSFYSIVILNILKNHFAAYREQVNLITSYIDASFLYGSKKGVAASVRVPDSCK